MSNNKNIKDLKIAVSGKSGCGNTTVSRMLAETLGLRFINFTFRTLAQERDLDLRDILTMAEKDDSWDKEVDSRQVQLAKQEGGCVLGSRLSIWMFPEADLKVYLSARPETRAKRIQVREGGALDEIAAFTASRDQKDHERYMKIYQIDNDDYSFADMVIETDTVGPKDITLKIIAELHRKFS
ncbi:MAG: (d)CMP kinase [Treponema sp.]|nr:(d)CMP kinase [Treponema sp.]